MLTTSNPEHIPHSSRALNTTQFYILKREMVIGVAAGAQVEIRLRLASALDEEQDLVVWLNFVAQVFINKEIGIRPNLFMQEDTNDSRDESAL